MEFKPQSEIFFVSDLTVRNLSLQEISTNVVGEKAFGVSCLPVCWTLPFVVVSSDFFEQLRDGLDISNVIQIWIDRILLALSKAGIPLDSDILIRSSGIFETIEFRGELHTEKTKIVDLKFGLANWATCMLGQNIPTSDPICLMIQVFSKDICKGHLSNERRCSFESRDWLGENETEVKPFKVHLRNWREKIDVSVVSKIALECASKLHIQKVMKSVAAWGVNDKRCRLHFEWIWDGERIFIVQADKEIDEGNCDPISLVTKRQVSDFIPRCLSLINEEEGAVYHKIHNSLLYKRLGLPVVPIYYLSNMEVIRDLSEGIMSEDLLADLNSLVQASLVIRTDIKDSSLSDKQMLPRTSEVRGVDAAKNWLFENSKKVIKDFSGKNIAYIFHNFVPSEAAAFSFSVPGERKVQIESLWGIPEGLYYNSHDKVVVDTGFSDFKKSISNVEGYKIKKKLNYKRNFVAPNLDGHWVNHVVKAPHDWSCSIRKDEWIRKIAEYSRIISENERKPLSIMWFVGTNSDEGVIPWYHEHYDQSIITRSCGTINKYNYNKMFVMKSLDDLEFLQKNLESGVRDINKILVRPEEEALLRDRLTLKKIGEVAKSLDAVIYIEGATLSHAYYQLGQTKVRVEVINPFDHDDDEQEFNKLVRDGVLEKIENGGELVKFKNLTGDDLFRALREKLVEEAFEVLDADDSDSVVEEIADLKEVVDAIVKSLNVSWDEVERVQDNKRKKIGGFENGVVLLNTKNPNLSDKYSVDDFQAVLPLEKVIFNGKDSSLHMRDNISKWSDRKKMPGLEEVILRVRAPSYIRSWNENTSEILLGEDKVFGKVNLTRDKNDIEITISLSTSERQLKLF